MKKFISLVLSLAIVFSICAVNVCAIDDEASTIAFASGSGTIDDPYIITTAKELDSVRENLNASYKLGCDIDLTEYLSENGEGYEKWGNNGWEPIGSSDQYFNGSFNGNYHSITGLWINRETSRNVGLFGCAGRNDYDSTIQNLSVAIAQNGISGIGNVGALAGFSSAEIENCSVSAENENACVRGISYLGGLIGSQDVLARTYNCYSTVNVVGSSTEDQTRCVGGLIGSACADVLYSYATGNVYGSLYCGGLIGELAEMANVSNCGANGLVNGTGDYVGGLIGNCYDSSISYSYSTGDVSGRNYVGGIVGSEAGKSSVSQNYYKGHITAISDYAGGIVGAQISPPYYDNFNSVNSCTVYGEITSQGEHNGAISGYMDSESSISDCYRSESFTINGNKIPSADENSVPNRINGGIKTGNLIIQSPLVIDIINSQESDKSFEVNLNIMGLDDIKELSYVEVNQKVENQDEIETGMVAYVNSQTDISPLMEDFNNNIGLFGGRERATVIYDYYKNIDYSISAADNVPISLSADGEYIICAEDNASNKTFIYINESKSEPQPLPTPDEYLYQINSLSIQSSSGTTLDTPPINESFIVDVSINKTEESDSKVYLFVAVYDENGILLSLDYVKSKFAPNYECSFGFNIPSQTSRIGSVKAYVWDSFNEATSLAVSKTLTFN